MWSTSMGSNPSGDRRASESSFGSPSGGSPSGGSGHTPTSRSSSSGRAALPTPPSPARAAALRVATRSPDTHPSGATPRPGAKLPIILGVALVIAGVGVVGAVVLRGEHSSSDAPAPRAARATAALEIRSEPAGAHILVDGSPSGLRTPATLTGLSVGITVRIGLDRPGYEPASETVNLVDARPRTISLTLKQATPAPQSGEDQQRSRE
jgi:hypothetical protein